MNTTTDFLKYTEYYIWWFMNCSQNVSMDQLIEDIDPMVLKLKQIYQETGTFYKELTTLEEIQLSGYKVSFYENMKEMDKHLEEEFQRELQYELKKEMDKDSKDYWDNYYREYWRKQYCA